MDCITSVVTRGMHVNPWQGTRPKPAVKRDNGLVIVLVIRQENQAIPNFQEPIKCLTLFGDPLNDKYIQRLPQLQLIIIVVDQMTLA